MSKKVQHGQYFTIYNPFKNKPFISWYKLAKENSENEVILEPFAGANNLIRTLEGSYNFKYKSFDIEPQSHDIEIRDTLRDFPEGYDIVVTNPPYLAKNSAKRKGLFHEYKYDDLYKDCLEKMLDNVGYVAAIIPATFLHWGKMQDRLYGYVLLTEKMFEDTETPVCLALFTPKGKKNPLFYQNSKKVNVSKDILDYKQKDLDIHFNRPKTANLALIAFDNTRERTIRFADVNEINLDMIKNTSRNIVCISVINKKITNDVINLLNNRVEEYRDLTHDIFLTPFKGVRRDGNFRRRIMFKQARAIIEEVLDANK